MKGTYTNDIHLDQFIDLFVDGYLSSDIHSMVDTRPNLRGMGGLGYPLVVTISTGMEILGRLSLPFTSRGKTRAGADDVSREAFCRYWNMYIRKISGYEEVDPEHFYKQIRSGIVHYYAAQGSVAIGKGMRSMHLHSADGSVFIDSALLAYDFLASISSWKADWLFSDGRKVADVNWLDIARKLDANNLLTNLPTNMFYVTGPIEKT